MSGLQIDNNVETGLQSTLERAYIKEYLHDKGFSLEDLETLPEEQAKNLMAEACRFASLKLAEMEARAKFRRKLTDIHQSRG